MNSQMSSPDDEFCKWLIRQVYSGTLTKSVRDKFHPLVSRSVREFVNDHISTTLKSALERGVSEQPYRSETNDDEYNQGNSVVTTAQEIEGYMIVKSILHSVVNIERISIQDMEDYCNIVLDGNNKFPICRMYFNTSNLQFSVFSVSGENKGNISSLNDIYKYSAQIVEVVNRYTSLTDEEDVDLNFGTPVSAKAPTRKTSQRLHMDPSVIKTTKTHGDVIKSRALTMWNQSKSAKEIAVALFHEGYGVGSGYEFGTGQVASWLPNKNGNHKA